MVTVTSGDHNCEQNINERSPSARPHDVVRDALREQPNGSLGWSVDTGQQDTQLNRRANTQSSTLREGGAADISAPFDGS